MTVQNPRDIEGILDTGRVVATIRDTMLAAVEPGMTTAELDEIGAELFIKHGATSSAAIRLQLSGGHLHKR